jgi:hypothetical protein
MVLGIKVDPVVVDQGEAPPPVPLRLEHPTGSVGQPVDQGRQHRAVSRQGADNGVDHHR